MGIHLVQVWWHPPGEPPMVVLEVTPLRVPLLAEALARYLAGDPADAG
jgi:hypothetical protein